MHVPRGKEQVALDPMTFTLSVTPTFFLPLESPHTLEHRHYYQSTLGTFTK